jgi:hypothetical protein
MMCIQINRITRITLPLIVIGFSSPSLYATDDPTDNQAAQSQNAEEQQESTNNTSGDAETDKWGNYWRCRFSLPSPPSAKVSAPL